MVLHKLKVITSNDKDQILVSVQSNLHENEDSEAELTNSTINEGPFLLTKISSSINNKDFNAITTLDIQNCHLTELKAELSKLNLKVLNVAKNRLKEIPQCLYEGLEHLEELDISFNNITTFEIAPKCIGSIITINASVNNFNEIPPWVFTKECNLKELIYSMNPQICSLNGDKIKPLNSSINNLEIKNCQIEERDFDYLKLFGMLNRLDLSNEGKVFLNFLKSADGLFSLLNLQAYLKVLILHKLGIPELPNSVKHFYCLEELHLEFNNLNYLPEDLSIVERLRVLKVGNNQLYKLPKSLRKMKNLEVIAAEFNFISKVDLKKMPSLKWLDLYHNEITEIQIDKSIELIDLELNYIGNLEEICVDYSKKRDDLREKSNLYLRSIGCIIEDDEAFSDSYKSFSSSSTGLDEVDSPDKGVQMIDEDEDWDDYYKKDFGELTLSDSEYQGDVPSISPTTSSKSSNDSVYDYLYEDAD